MRGIFGGYARILPCTEPQHPFSSDANVAVVGEHGRVELHCRCLKVTMSILMIAVASNYLCVIAAFTFICHKVEWRVPLHISVVHGPVC